MSWRWVEGVALPDAVGGHPALDFCNTRAGWGAPAPKEYLVDDRALALWARDNGLGPADHDHEHVRDAAAGRTPPGTGATSTVREAWALRDAVRACALGPSTAGDWQLVSRLAARARAAGTLGRGPDGGPAAWTLDPDLPAPTAALLRVAEAAEDLLTSPLGTCVAACPGRGCGWVFADPRRRRRWCSMAVCGNRAKASRHKQRRVASAEL